jgi:predicted nucleic acid-binding protein
MKLFVDASGWVPMEMRRDQWRPELDQVMAMLRQERRLRMVTTNWTVYEALAIARRRAGDAAGRLHSLITLQANVISVPEAAETEALRRFLTWSDLGASVVDHVNVIVAERERCDAILSFDRDFVPLAAAAGLRILRYLPASGR